MALSFDQMAQLPSRALRLDAVRYTGLRDGEARFPMRSIAMFIVLLAAGTAQASDKPVFTLDGKVFRSVENPEQYVEIGEMISFVELGRRFLCCSVSATYEAGGDEPVETVIYSIKAHYPPDVEFSMFVENDKIVSGYTFSAGIAGANGIEKGDSLRKALRNPTAYCFLREEDTNAYCQESEDAPLAYYVSDGDDCDLEMDREGWMTTPTCRIYGMTTR